MSQGQNTIYREMVMDLLYRLRLADQIFSQTTDAVMSAMSLGVVAEKQKAVEQLCKYSKALKVVYADFLHVSKGQHVVFPADVALWQWNEPDGEAIITKTIERLHAIAEGMEASLNNELVIEMRSEK